MQKSNNHARKERELIKNMEKNLDKLWQENRLRSVVEKEFEGLYHQSLAKVRVCIMGRNINI